MTDTVPTPISPAPRGDAGRGPARSGRFGRGYTLGVLVLLMFVNALNYLDRQILTVLAVPIKADLQLTNTQVGLMSGLAFALVYCLVGLPIARLADRWNRVWILSVCLALWSGMTALCGFAQNFWQLFLARVGVGVGEAGCSPTSHSLITDYVPAERRASALSLFALGVPIGTFLGLAVGGLVAQRYGWQAAFLIVGVPGVVLAVLLPGLVREPRVASSPAHQEAVPPVAEVLRRLGRQPAFRHLCAAAAISSLLNFGTGAFLGLFFAGFHGLSLASIGVQLGIVLGLGWFVGIALSGVLADRRRTDDPGAYASVPAWAMLTAVPLTIAAFLVTTPTLALALLLIPTALNAFMFGPANALVQTLAAPRERALAAALFMTVASLVGIGFGPLLVGGLTDAFTTRFQLELPCADGDTVCPSAESRARQWALIATNLLGIWAAAHLFVCARALRRVR